MDQGYLEFSNLSKAKTSKTCFPLETPPLSVMFVPLNWMVGVGRAAQRSGPSSSRWSYLSDFFALPVSLYRLLRRMKSISCDSAPLCSVPTTLVHDEGRPTSTRHVFSIIGLFQLKSTGLGVGRWLAYFGDIIS